MTLDTKGWPRWALIAVLAVTVPGTGYALVQHMENDQGQDETLDQLVKVTDNLVTVVEYNREFMEDNSSKIKDLEATQHKLDILLARIEVQLDKSEN